MRRLPACSTTEELTEAGYRVLTAENGLQALGLLEDEKVDLLIDRH